MTPADAPYKFDRADGCTAAVQGEIYTVWANYGRRGMFAMDADGYISKGLTCRKAVAGAFGLESFRK